MVRWMVLLSIPWTVSNWLYFFPSFAGLFMGDFYSYPFFLFLSFSYSQCTWKAYITFLAEMLVMPGRAENIDPQLEQGTQSISHSSLCVQPWWHGARNSISVTTEGTIDWFRALILVMPNLMRDIRVLLSFYAWEKLYCVRFVLPQNSETTLFIRADYFRLKILYMELFTIIIRVIPCTFFLWNGDFDLNILILFFLEQWLWSYYFSRILYYLLSIIGYGMLILREEMFSSFATWGKTLYEALPTYEIDWNHYLSSSMKLYFW